MDYFKKNKVLGWIIVVGLVINIAAISTILYKVYFQRDKLENNRFQSKEPHDFISKELNLSPEQIKKFKEIKDSSKEEAKTIFTTMSNQRKELLNELAVINPDTFKINNYISEIEKSQSLLLHHTVNHYLKLKNVLREDQYENLNLLFMDMFGCDKNKGGKCGRNENNGGKRHRHGQEEGCNKDF
jgi:Spy/CpxP family protein refolding chaperone